MINTVISDVDGTAVKPGDAAVCEEYEKTFEKVIESGLLMCFASGRSFYEMKLMLENLGENVVFVANDGAFCATACGKKEIFKSPIDFRNIICLFAAVSSFASVGIELCSKYCSYVYGSEKFCLAMRKERKNQIKVISSANEIKSEIYKITLFNLTEFSKRHVKNEFSQSLKIAYEREDVLELVLKDISKQVAIEKIKQTYGVENSEILAIGNGDNDIEMLRNAGMALAVDNADVHIKNICNKTINSISEIEKILGI